MFITLPANQARVEAGRAELAKLLNQDPEARVAKRQDFLKEVASGDADLQRVSLSEGRFIDLAMHMDSFLDDAAINSTATSDQPIVWKSEYAPTVGVTTGSTFGGGTSTTYATQENHAFLQPNVIETMSPKLPRMLLSQDINKLGLRDKAMLRQAEAMRLKKEQILSNIIFGQPLGTPLAQSVVNYFNADNSYANKTVFVADPGVQSGTYETSNLLDCSTEGGLTPAVFEALMMQEQKTKRKVKTIHMAVQGFAFRKLLRVATIITTTGLTAGHTGNPSLEGVPASQFEKFWNTNFGDVLAGGLIIEIFGNRYKIKANNVLPEGYMVVTTDQPAAEIIDVTNLSVSTDIEDPKEPYWAEHYEKQVFHVGVPDPWVRNIWVAHIGATTLV